MVSANAPVRVVALVLAAGAALGGCREAPASPELLPLEDVTFSGARVRWLEPVTGAVQRYQVEQRVAAGDFSVVAEVGGDRFEASVPLADAPEGQDVELRVRALPDDGVPRRSGAVSLRHGLRAPTLSCFGEPFGCRPVDGRLTLLIENRSRVATSLVLERRIERGGAAEGEPRVVRLDPATRVHVDEIEWDDGRTFTYALHAEHGADASTTSSQRTFAPAGVPAALDATPLPLGVRLTFRSASAVDRQFTVRRRAGSDEASEPRSGMVELGTVPVPAGAVGTFDDPGAVAPGAYEYEVAEAGTAPFPPRLAIALVDAQQPGWLGARRVDVLGGLVADRDASGAFAVAARRTDGWFVLPGLEIRPADAGAPPLEAGAAVADPRPVVLCPAPGRVDALYVESRGGPPPFALDLAVVHASRGGDGWVREDVASSLTSAAGLRADVGVDGTLHAFWDLRDLHVATLGPAGWSHDVLVPRLDLTLPAATTRAALAGDGQGMPHLVLSEYGRPVHVWRDPTGWHSEPVPDVVECASAVGTADGLAVACLRTAGGSVVLRRTAAGWSPPEPVPLDAWASILVRSPDGERLALVEPSGATGHRRVALWDGTSWASRSWSAAWYDHAANGFAAGIGADGKLWILDALPSFDYGSPPAVLYEER